MMGATSVVIQVLTSVLLISVFHCVRSMSLTPNADQGLYTLGVGMHDITGPAAGVNLMGYGNPSQINKGIHLRLYSRAFIFDDGFNRLVFVSADMGMMAQVVKLGVLERLEALYGSQYTSSNVILSGTHTHSGPAGYLQYLLFQVTSLGFIRSSYDATVEGVVQSIVRAHDSVVPGRLYLNSGDLLNASINRSPTSYLNNPEDERALYEHDTDKTMTLLRLEAEDGTPLGMINWFAVHPTSMNNTNTLVSSDNKGYASQLFEHAMNPGALPGQGKFVAAFAQSNCGDVSPNTQGPRCQDTGEVCDLPTSTCGGRVQMCIASGPGKDMEESTKIIGTLQFQKAMELYKNSSAVAVTGPVGAISQQLDMINHTVQLPNGTMTRTCKPALGYSFAAGTIDGPGAFDFTQGMISENPFWNMIVQFIYPTDPDQIVCQKPKPVLLDTGNYNLPYAWHPHIVETQMGRVGQLVLAAVPGEFTTMSGRRLRNAVSAAFAAAGVPDVVPVVAGLSNVYSHYIATHEEYVMQRYEAASTLYGPHTLTAYLQQYTALSEAIAKNATVPSGPAPPNLLESQMTLLPGVIFDGTSLGYDFGEVLAQPYPYAFAGETVIAKFVSGHPRNDPQLGRTFLTVERLSDTGSWEVVATDANWDTKFSWERTSMLLGTSIATVSWSIPEDTPEGTYRLTHTGHHKTLLGGIYGYKGVTDAFEVALHSSNTIEPRIERRDGEANDNGGFIAWIRRFFG